MAENPLDMAECHVLEGERHIAHQRRLLARPEQHGTSEMFSMIQSSRKSDAFALDRTMSVLSGQLPGN